MAGIDTIGRLPATCRRLVRFRQIVHVFVKYGFGSLFDTMRSGFSRTWRRLLSPWHPEVRRRMQEIGSAERLREALVELGPTFVKLGQILATRQDMIPAAMVEELSKLQDSVPPFSYEEVRRLVKQELKGEIEEIFSEFDETPVGAASMAQGHRARLKDGTVVFVKMQRPGIAPLIHRDLDILEVMAEAMEKHSEQLAVFRPRRIMAEFRRSLENELDFMHERMNQEKFARQFEGREGIRVPKVFARYCTKRILTMEFVQGIKGTNLPALKGSGLDLVKMSHNCADIILEQFFEHGFYHADPHPGNIFFLPGDVFCYVDFGQMGRVTVMERRNCAALLRHLVERDYHASAVLLLELTEHDDNPDMAEIEREVGDFAEKVMHQSLSSLEVPSVLSEMLEMCRHLHMYLKPQFYLFLKALGMSDELGRQMNPEFEIMDQVRPYVLKMLIQQFRPEALWRETEAYGSEIMKLLREYPEFLRAFNRKLLDGNVGVKVSVDSIDNMNRVFDGVFNRLAAAVVLASLVIGSSIVVHANPKPHWYDTSIMGVVGFLMSGIFGIVLLISILKHRS